MCTTQKTLNPLTTNDDYSHHQNLAACHQLAQSVLKIGSALAESVGQGEVGGCTPLADSAWRLLQLAIERLHVTSQGAWLSLVLMLQSCKFFKVILEVQVTQICSMDILRLTIDFIKMSKVWSLCMEFYACHAP